MKKVNFFQFLLLLVLSSSISFAQLVKIEKPNMVSEADIYKSANGVMYSKIIKFAYNKKMVDVEKGKGNVDENKIKFTEVKKALKKLKDKYGNLQIKKIHPNIQWGDTIKINRRTKKQVVVPDLSQHYVIEFEDLVPYDSIAQYLMTIKNIKFAEGPLVGYLTSTNPNDPWYYNSSSEGAYKWAFDVINAQEAWDITKGSSSIKVGIHDQFNYSIGLHNEIASKVTYESSWLASGHHGDHGTMSAGIVGAKTNNSTDIASLGWNVSLMLAQWGYPYSNITDLVDNGADIINFSWITTYDSPSLKSIIQYALLQGVICVASAGNNESPLPGMRYPAAYNFGGSTGQVIAVSGTRLNSGTEEFIPYYNYSPGTNLSSTGFIDFAAPGSNYRSLSWSSTTGTQHIWEGTSISAPFVSALVALMLSVDNTLTVNEVYDILKRTSDKIGQYSYDSNGWNRYMGYGRINAADAVNVATGAPSRPDNLTVSSIRSNPWLSWSANPESNVISYLIYRKENNGPWYQIANTSNTYYKDTDVSTNLPYDTYHYKIKAVNSSNKYSIFSDEVSINGIMPKYAEDEDYTQPIYEYSISNYPNPYNPTTTINYSIKEQGNVNIVVYDALGRKVKELVNEVKQPGSYKVSFDGSNLSSGIFFYTMSVNNYTASKKMILTK